MNPFESGERLVIPASLIYARWKGRVLMLHRNAKGPEDPHHGKFNGIGGKFELDESPLEAARREFFEEAGVDLPAAAFRSIGLLHFPHFRPSKEQDWTVWVFLADFGGRDPKESGLKERCPEGDLRWIEPGDLLGLPLWEGDKHFLPYVLEEKPFIGTFWYDGDALKKHWVAPLARPLDPAVRA